MNVPNNASFVKPIKQTREPESKGQPGATGVQRVTRFGIEANIRPSSGLERNAALHAV